MTPGDEEARIRAALAEAHRRDAGVTPSFARLWGVAHRPRVRRPFIRWVVVSASVAAVALFVWRVQRPDPLPSALPSGTRWTAPTDFLLDTPDLVTLRTVPALDPAVDPFLRPPTDRREQR